MCRQYTGVMEVNLSPDLEGKLSRAAGRRGISAELLIREAIERAVDYDDWFIREVERGLAQVDAGQVLTHDAVGARLEHRLAEHQPRR
jgi:predicted transcriptional regulator